MDRLLGWRSKVAVNPVVAEGTGNFSGAAAIAAGDRNKALFLDDVTAGQRDGIHGRHPDSATPAVFHRAVPGARSVALHAGAIGEFTPMPIWQANRFACEVHITPAIGRGGPPGDRCPWLSRRAVVGRRPPRAGQPEVFIQCLALLGWQIHSIALRQPQEELDVVGDFWRATQLERFLPVTHRLLDVSAPDSGKGQIV